MKTKINTRQITGVGILLALTIVLGFVSNYVVIANININLALIPIVVCACIYGPYWGAFLGVIDGLVILSAPTTLTYFFSVNPVATVFLCVLKTGIAGLLSGFLFKAIYKKNDLVASIIASLIVPIANTGIFIAGAYLFFTSVYGGFTNILSAVLTINFAIEFGVNIILSPAIYRIVKVVTKKKNIGSYYQG